VLGRATAIGAACAASAAIAAPAHAQGEHTQQTTGNTRPSVTTHDTLQPAQLPPLPAGMTLETIAQGDSIFHGAGNCFACHGSEGEGRPGAGNAITVSLNWAQYEWRSIDSLITHGIPQTITRSPMMMPPRGGKSNLTDEQVRRVAAYVWAISQVRGEPWPGGHRSHGALVPAGADEGTATRTLVRRRPPASGGTRR
jgi:mono/diheme cytochrome c family protein